VEVFEGSQLELWTLEHLVAGSAPDWLTSLIHGGGVQTVTVNDPGDGVTVGDLDASLPERSLVVALTRDGDTSIPDADETVLGGDRVTLLGGSSAVTEGATHLQADRNAP
jgi:uncharacterized transporter YbjL